MNVHTMNHPDIVFSSMNFDIVKGAEKSLEGITLRDIKLDLVQDRHRLLLDIGLGGDFPLWDEYMYLRGVKYKQVEDKMMNSKCPHHMAETSYREIISENISKHLLDEYGWVI